MTKQEALKAFRQEVLPSIPPRANGDIDHPARREAWGIFIDALCKSGQITLQQYETWDYPTEGRDGRVVA